MSTAPKAKRAQRSVSLSPHVDAMLQKEADARMLHPSVLVEKALAAWLPTLPPVDLDGSES